MTAALGIAVIIVLMVGVLALMALGPNDKGDLAP